ncbi:hypothetical protein [Photobacterium damselae]|uniref:hypothetical protein n=1 Tax=Photobacterium damselae TaxID=38293 RepID=UPI000D081A35|nr:hypothetical protein [Photobacterium damselae]PSB80706.1 hypothetical protein C5F62_13995 [Photobacterium damselae subsp. damselae]
MKTKIKYILTVYSVQILNIILNLLFMRYLTSAQIGVLNIAKILSQLPDYAHVGTRFSLDRYVPVEKKTLAINYAIISFFISSIVSFIILLVMLYFGYNSTLYLSFYFSGVVLAQGNILKSYYRARGDTILMIKIPLFLSVIPLSIVSVTFYLFSTISTLNLYFIPFLISGCFIFVQYFSLLLKWFLSNRFSFNDSKKFFFSSSILMINSVVIFLYSAIDRFYLSFKYGDEFLGEYSIIIFSFSALLVFPGILSELIFPKIVKGVIEDKRILFVKELLFILIPTILAIICINVLMGLFINDYTKYGYLLKYIEVMSWGVIPYCVSAVYYHILNALDLRYEIVLSNIIVLIVLFIGLFLSYTFNISDIFYFIILKFLVGFVLALSYVCFVLKKHRFVNL